MVNCSPLSGKYLVRRPIANLGLRVLDRLLEVFQRPRNQPLCKSPRRILLCNGAHLGDVLLTTSLLPLLKETFPDATIGFLIGSWARPVLEDHPGVDRIHVFDHFKLNRAAKPLAWKIRRHCSTAGRAIAEVRRQRYDMAVDAYYYYPNSIPLLWQAGIPVRIGYTSGGFGPLLTHSLDWVHGPRHVVDYQADLLRFLPGLTGKNDRTLMPSPARLNADSLQATLRRLGLPVGGYILLHAGAGSGFKAWPRQKWRALTKALAARGERLVFTGSREERSDAAQVGQGIRSVLNLCGELAWREFIAVVQHARALIGVDSVAGHVAAGVGTPYLVISTSINDPEHWRPRGGGGGVLVHPVPCGPCYRNGGCPEMDCVRGVEVKTVLDALARLCPPTRRTAS
jgi:ADP-heptose:LPS heptosyltransferase